MDYLEFDFERGLLDKSNEEKLLYFYNFKSKHPSLDQTHDEIIHTIYESKRALIILVVGPAGVGKTTLVLGVEKYILSKVQSLLEHNKGKIPVVRSEIPQPESSVFDWVDFFSTQLVLLREPLLDSKANLDKAISHQEDSDFLSTKELKKVVKFRRSYIKALKNRYVDACMFDEGQHFTKVASARKLKDQLDYIKTLANVSRVPHVLIGTYDLLEFVNLSAQLGRRTKIIHFKRYHADINKDKEAFIGILLTFLRQIPLKVPYALSCDWDFFYAGCIGCVGVLKDWLYEALAYCLRTGSKILTKEALKKTAMSVNALLTMVREAKEKEKIIDTEHSSSSILRQELLLPKKPKNQGKDTKPKKKHRKVGERNPTRDKVGFSDFIEDANEKIA